MTQEEALQHYRQAEQLFRSADYQGALGHLDEVRQLFPDNRNVVYYRAVCLGRLGKAS
jgi:Flp pilus assembly protein TadD